MKTLFYKDNFYKFLIKTCSKQHYYCLLNPSKQEAKFPEVSKMLTK